MCADPLLLYPIALALAFALALALAFALALALASFLNRLWWVRVPKASFFRSMAGGVPSGATEGSSMAPGRGRSLFVFWGFVFWNLVCSENLIFCDEKSRFRTPFWGPKRRDPGDRFFKVFRAGFRAPFWPPLGLVLAPSWPILDSSWPHLGPSLPHIGLILALSWPCWPLLAPTWPCLGSILAMLADLGCTWPHLGPSWLHHGLILAPSGLFVVSWWTTRILKISAIQQYMQTAFPDQVRVQSYTFLPPWLSQTQQFPSRSIKKATTRAKG